MTSTPIRPAVARRPRSAGGSARSERTRRTRHRLGRAFAAAVAAAGGPGPGRGHVVGRPDRHRRLHPVDDVAGHRRPRRHRQRRPGPRLGRRRHRQGRLGPRLPRGARRDATSRCRAATARASWPSSSSTPMPSVCRPRRSAAPTWWPGSSPPSATTGSDAGLFGAQDPTFDGAYRQGLSLAALAGGRVPRPARRSPGRVLAVGPAVQRRRVDQLRHHVQPLQRQAGRLRGPRHQLDGAGRRGPGGPARARRTAAAAALHFLTRAQDRRRRLGLRAEHGQERRARPIPTRPHWCSRRCWPSARRRRRRSCSKAADPVAVLDSFQIAVGPGAGRAQLPGDRRPEPAGHLPGRPGAGRRDLRLRPRAPRRSPAWRRPRARSPAARRARDRHAGSPRPKSVHFGTSPATVGHGHSSTSLTAVAPRRHGRHRRRHGDDPGRAPVRVGPADHFTYKA